MQTLTYIQSLHRPDIRFKVVDFDKASGVATLEGSNGVQFEMKISRDILQAKGYKMIREIVGGSADDA